MPGSLVLIDSETASNSASIVLSGIDSTYDVYMAQLTAIKIDTDNKNMLCQVTTSGTADSDSEYDTAYRNMYSNSSFGGGSGTNGTSVTFGHSMGTGTGELLNATLYLYNFANASEHSLFTVERTYLNLTPDLVGIIGAFVHTVDEANDGLAFTVESSNNFTSGEFRLYGIQN